MKKGLILILSVFLMGNAAMGKNFVTRSVESVFHKRNKVDFIKKYSLDDNAMKNWEETFAKVIIDESELEDWYGAGNPIEYLARTGKLTQKKAKFLDSLKTSDAITDADKKEFNEILSDVVAKLPREYYLKNENIKNGPGLARYMIAQSQLGVNNPSVALKRVIGFQNWSRISAFSRKTDLTEKEIKEFRKILNKALESPTLYNPTVWANTEVSDRMEEVNKIYAKPGKTKTELNNINAKALYVAYHDYLSALDKWND